MKRMCILLLTFYTSTMCSWSAQPMVTNIRASQRAGSKLVDIYYNVSDADGHAQTVQVYVSGDNGLTFRIPAVTFTGAVGANVTPGVNKHIVWDAGHDWNGQFVESTKVRIVCSDGTTPVPPLNMVYIPAGAFQMGDNLNENNDDAKPVHTVNVDGFFMEKFEVSGALWTDVRTWATANGYNMSVGNYSAPNHPVNTVNWYDCIKWCNARSERDGLTPVYYTTAAQSQVYRSGNTSITNVCVNWNANGYRLPTEAEWEKAARGGLMGKRYPWGDNIGGSNANYTVSGDPFENGTTPCGYYDGMQTPIGPDMANGYGLYDMAGNVFEWCWDQYDSTYYGRQEANTNPKGPGNWGQWFVLRGGGYARWGETEYLRCARRNLRAWPTGDAYWDTSGSGSAGIYPAFGFRSARGR